MSLFSAELHRITRRRVAKGAVGIAGVGIVAAGALTFMTHSNAAPDLVAAQAAADQNTVECLRSYAADAYGMSASEIDTACVSDPAWFVNDQNFYLQSLLTGGGTNQSFDQARDQAFARTSYPEIGEESNAYGFASTLAGVGVLVALGAAMLGATLVGADWRSGVIESQLVRQPNRQRLFAAKFGAIALTTGLSSAVFAGLLAAAMVPAALWRGSTANTGVDFWLEVASMAGRIGLASAVLAVIGGAIAMTARNTAAGVGVGLFAFIAGGIVGAMEGSWTPFVAVPKNLGAWIAKGDVSWTFIQESNGSSNWYEVMGYSWLGAGLLLITVMTVMTFIGASTFVRRDVS